MQPRILYVIGSMQVGGAETQLLNLATQMIAGGAACVVFAMDATGPLAEEFRRRHVEVIDGGHRPGKAHLLIRCFFRLQRQMFTNKPSVVHGMLPLANFFAALTATIARVPLRLSARRSLGLYQDETIIWRLIDPISSACSDLVLVNSNAVREDAKRRDSIPELRWS